MKFLRNLLLLLVWMPTAAATADTVTTITAKVLENGEGFDLLTHLDWMESYKSRPIRSITIYARTPDQNNSTVLRINDEEMTVNVTALDSSGHAANDAYEFVFAGELAFKDLKKLELAANTKTGIGMVTVKHDDLPIGDVDGNAYAEPLERLDRLTQFGLYDEDNNSDLKPVIRLQATKDLAQYPSIRAFRIAAERFGYHGQWVDFDLHYQARDQAKAMAEVIMGRVSDEDGIRFIEAGYDVKFEPEIRQVALNSTRSLKTGIAIPFLIKAAGDNFRSFRPASEELLREAWKKPEADAVVKGKLTELLALLLEPENDDTYQLWVKQEVLTTLAALPQERTVAPLFAYLHAHNVNNFNEESSMHDALIGAMDLFDLKDEIAPMVAAFGEIIAEPGEDHLYSHTPHCRLIAVRALEEAGSQDGLPYLQKALEDPELREDLRAAVTRAIETIKAGVSP